jgi:hypothetical protein
MNLLLDIHVASPFPSVHIHLITLLQSYFIINYININIYTKAKKKPAFPLTYMQCR